jgi:hypothetical protein
MNAVIEESSDSHHAPFAGALDEIRDLILQSTSVSLNQAVLRLEEVREGLLAGTSGLDGLNLTDTGKAELKASLVRLWECGKRGEQMISGRLQLIMGADLLYDRLARPAEVYLPCRMQVEG